MTITHYTSLTGKSPLNEEGLEDALEKKSRIKKELIRVGVTAYGLLKFNSRYLPSVMHDNEHIEGVIYGRYSEGPGPLNNVDRMIIATDRRLISLNHKPGYTDIDEFTYDIINGVTETKAGPFAAVSLHTKASHISVRYVNRRCADIFTHFIEKRRFEYYKPK